MPCNLGYRSVAKARLAAPKPVTFESRQPAPEIDPELLERLGVSDPVFADWVRGLDPTALLEKALERAIEAVGPSGVELAIRGGELAARTTVRNDAERSRARRAIDQVARRWQVEVLRVVAEVLDYEVSLSEEADGSLVIEGEKASGGDVREWLRVSLDARGEAVLRFEHFKSEAELDAEEDRFRALSRRLGVRIAGESRREGSPIPAGAKHRHKGGGKN